MLSILLNLIPQLARVSLFCQGNILHKSPLLSTACKAGAGFDCDRGERAETKVLK